MMQAYIHLHHASVMGIGPRRPTRRRTMNLYYIQGSRALAPHIVAIEAGIPVQTIEVDFPTKQAVPSGADYLSVNPTGHVPALALAHGEAVSEAPVVVQDLADMRPEPKQAPAN